MENSYDELFDDHLKGKLENFKETGAANGWEALQDKMDADAALSEDPFDAMIKSKLEGGKAAYDPGFWSLMESRIEADADLTPAELDDLELDGLIYENLNAFQVPYNPNHWELMLQRITAEFSIQHQLYKYKFAEISLMALLILTLLQFYPGQKISNQNEAAIATVESVSPNQASADHTDLQGSVETADTGNNSSSKASLIASTEDDVSEVLVQEDFNNNNTSSTTSNEKIALVDDVDNTETALPSYVKEEHGGTSISSEIIVAQEAADKAAQQALTERKAAMEEKAALLFDQSVLGLLALESTSMEAFETGEEQSLRYCAGCGPKTPWLFKLGMLASLDFNLVMTPFDAYFSSDSYDQLTTGYTGGLNFSIHRKRLGFATGVTYSSKAYEPRQNKEVFGSLARGYIEEGLQAAQINILSVPANFTYTFDNKGKWQWYTLLGASAKLATINNFDNKIETVSGSRYTPDPRIPLKPVPDTEVDTEDPYSGAFEGGSFQKNFFLTANLGFGMERYVTPRWSVFFQPTYQHSLYKRGLGPNNDRIHSMSLFLGTRATLK